MFDTRCKLLLLFLFFSFIFLRSTSVAEPYRGKGCVGAFTIKPSIKEKETKALPSGLKHAFDCHYLPFLNQTKALHSSIVIHDY